MISKSAAAAMIAKMAHDYEGKSWADLMIEDGSCPYCLQTCRNRACMTRLATCTPSVQPVEIEVESSESKLTLMRLRMLGYAEAFLSRLMKYEIRKLTELIPPGTKVLADEPQSDEVDTYLKRRELKHCVTRLGHKVDNPEALALLNEREDITHLRPNELYKRMRFVAELQPEELPTYKSGTSEQVCRLYKKDYLDADTTYILMEAPWAYWTEEGGSCVCGDGEELSYYDCKCPGCDLDYEKTACVVLRDPLYAEPVAPKPAKSNGGSKWRRS
jgi:hypothetical protein